VLARQIMDTVASTRHKEIARIQRTLERLHSPRLQMMLIVALTASVGFLASFALFHVGVESMWIRYPSAVVIAYVAFLFLLWCWLRLRGSDFLDGLDVPSPSTGGGRGLLPKEAWEPGGGQFGGGGASGSFEESTEVARVTADTGPSSSGKSSGISDALGGFDLEELVVVLLAITALVGATLAAVWIVWAAPALLAELMLDATLAAGLYRRLRGVEGEHWLYTAIRRTVWPAIGVAILFSFAGAGMQIYAPGAKSIGQVIHHSMGAQ